MGVRIFPLCWPQAQSAFSAHALAILSRLQANWIPNQSKDQIAWPASSLNVVPRYEALFLLSCTATAVPSAPSDLGGFSALAKGGGTDISSMLAVSSLVFLVHRLLQRYY